MSRPWIKHIFLFVRQTMGCNMTLGSCSRYIDLCPPPFGYPSKHMESLCCLLLRKLMINAMLPKSHHLSCFCPWEVSTKPESDPLQFALVLIPNHPKCPIKSLFEINEAFILIIKII
jgi:hypothetical protein